MYRAPFENRHDLRKPRPFYPPSHQSGRATTTPVAPTADVAGSTCYPKVLVLPAWHLLFFTRNSPPNPNADRPSNSIPPLKPHIGRLKGADSLLLSDRILTP